MRLFISYARVDKPYCIQIVNVLDVHDTWYDQRLYAGQNWWQEILRRLDWCEGFVYLISPDSVASEYCRKEFELAQSLGRHIFPVLIHPKTSIPTSLSEIQYADLSKGLTVEAVKVLLNSLYLAEHHRQTQPILPVAAISSDEIKPPSVDPATVISSATTAMEKGQFDQAVFLLKQAKASNFTLRFISIDAILAEAEAALEKQSYLRKAEREYRQIADLVRYKRTSKLGCEAFAAFRKEFPDFDPDGLEQICAISTPHSASPLISVTDSDVEPVPLKLPLLEWCEVAAGPVRVEVGSNGHRQTRHFAVEGFRMSKYPVTNAQYQVFLEDPSGYANPDWWSYSGHAQSWRSANPEPKPSSFKGEERPREMVSWYDAIAFCQWLSKRLGMVVSLPTGSQWQRAARGDDLRQFPWGDKFDIKYANTHESGLKMTTLVIRYPENVSPFGIHDMAGNVWEWCLNAKGEQGGKLNITSNDKRLVHGGSFMSPYQRSQISFEYYLDPQTYYASIGFRLVCPSLVVNSEAKAPRPERQIQV